MTLSLGRQMISAAQCSTLEETVRALATVLDGLGNPGTPAAPGEVTPCGEVYGPAYVRNDGGNPAISYVDSDGVCQDVSTGGGTGDNVVIIRATSDENTSATEFSATITESIYGTSTPGATVTFTNPFGNTFTIGQAIFGVKRASDGKYVPDRDSPATFSGTTINTATLVNSTFIVEFQLNQGFTRDATEALAVMVEDSTPIYVLDPHQEFFGKKDHTDAGGESVPGLRGYGILYTTNHNSTGLPGYRILAMEGWKRFLVVEIFEDTEENPSTAKCTIVGEYGGVPFGSNMPPKDGVGWDITAYDQHDLIRFGKEGDKWVVGLADDVTLSGNPRYHFLCPVKDQRIRIAGTCIEDIDRTTASFTMDNVEVLAGAQPINDPTHVVTVHVPTNAKMNCPAGTILYAFHDITRTGGVRFEWDSGDAANWYWIARGRTGFDPDKKQVLYNFGNFEADMQWKEVVSTTHVTDIGEPTLTVADGVVTMQINYTREDCEIIRTAEPEALFQIATHAGSECE